MNEPVSSVSSPIQTRAFHSSYAVHAASEVVMTEERLPFSVKLVRNEEDLKKAVQIRQSAYARHMPEVAETLRDPEKVDTEEGVGVLLAVSKVDGSALGSVRIQTNRYRPLSLEKSVELPAWLKDQSLAQVSRFGVVNGTIGRLVKMVLVKGCLQYSEQNGVDWDVIAARAPLDRTYIQLTYQDIFPGAGYIPLAHMGNVPHRIMGFEVETCKARLTQMNHPLLNFFCHTHHPDLDVGSSERMSDLSIAHSTHRASRLLL